MLQVVLQPGLCVRDHQPFSTGRRDRGPPPALPSIRLATLTIERREILTPSPQRYEAGTRGGDDGK